MRQNLTLSLDKETVRKARVLAARRDTSISALVTAQIERLVDSDDTYIRARRQALALLDKGFDLGGTRRVDRAALHER